MVQVLSNPLRYIPIPDNRLLQNITSSPSFNVTYIPVKPFTDRMRAVHTDAQGPDLWFLPLVLIGVFVVLVRNTLENNKGGREEVEVAMNGMVRGVSWSG